MKLQIVTDFLKTKKGKASIATVIGGIVLYFFPGSADMVASFSDALAEILTGISDKVHPDHVDHVTVIANTLQP